jgi:hypothetical protein
MQNAFETPSGGWVYKNHASQLIPPQPAVGANDPGSEDGAHFLKPRFTRLDYLPGQIIGVHHRHAPRT